MMKDFILYKKDMIIFYLLTLVLIPILYLLYGETIGPLIYESVIYSFVVIVYLLYQYYLFYKKHQILSANFNNQAIQLPESDHRIEKDYTEIIVELIERNNVLKTQFINYKDDINQYYSLWVHQVKTPIAATRLLIDSGNLDQELLKQEIFKIEQYSNMVLQYIRANNISNDLEIKKYSLKSMIHQVLKKYASFFIHSKIVVQLNDLEMNIVTDEKWLVFVIEQLIDNAIKYTKEGLISIRAYEDHQYQYLEILDSGIGIRKEDIPRIFEKGFTGFNGRIDKSSSGIGLYLVKKILDGLSHRIDIDSVIKEGTKVTIIFSKKRFEEE